MYLDILPSKLIDKTICLSSHKLRIESDIYYRNRTPRKLRYYILCNVNNVEDEYYFVLVCPAFIELRKNILRRITIEIPVLLSFVNY